MCRILLHHMGPFSLLQPLTRVPRKLAAVDSSHMLPCSPFLGSNTQSPIALLRNAPCPVGLERPKLSSCSGTCHSCLKV